VTIYSKNKSLKNSVWEKTQGKCYLCGCELLPFGNREDNSFHMDHKNPASKGGATQLENLFPACLKCNHIKGTRTYEDFLLFVKSRVEHFFGIPKSAVEEKCLMVYLYNFDNAEAVISQMRTEHLLAMERLDAMRVSKRGASYAWT
jgi:hypothetical protein